MEIELVNSIPELEDKYKRIVCLAIDKELITEAEWNTRFKNYRDDCGYSFIHYLEAKMNNIDRFVTVNPIMLDNRKELQNRFNVKIQTPQEIMDESDTSGRKTE